MDFNDQPRRILCFDGDESDESKEDITTKRARTSGTPSKDDGSTLSIYDEVNDIGIPYSTYSENVKSGFRTKRLERGLHKTRRTNDEVHSSIDFCPVISVFIDTRAFQRLRGLRQLGAADYVYCNANHTRFEHSIGVAHLAAKLVESILRKQPSLRRCTNKKDILCIKLAGLFHDIGHGPFSHTYEEFVKCVQKQSGNERYKYLSDYPPLPADWRHECCSLEMIDSCLREIGLEIDPENLEAPLKQIGDGIDAKSIRADSDEEFDEMETNTSRASEKFVLTSRDFIFIKECIWGGALPSMTGLLGRPHIHHEWLYDIVSNSHSGLDVDKIDYFARDVRRCEGEAGEINKVFIEEAVVSWGTCTKIGRECPCQHRTYHQGQHLMICYPDKMIDASMDFFQKRFNLHKKIYQHKTVIAAGLMICDIFCEADQHLLLPVSVEQPLSTKTKSFGAAGDDAFPWKKLPMSRAMLNRSTFLILRDSIVDSIEISTNPDLQKARNLIQRLRSRKFYKCAINKAMNAKDHVHMEIWKKSESEIKMELLNFRGKHQLDCPISLSASDCSDCDQIGSHYITLKYDDIIVSKGDIHYGLKDKNPVSRMRFLKKKGTKQLGKNVGMDGLHLSIDKLPEAKQASEATYLSVIPSSFIEYRMRVYSRDSSKVELVQHVFELWWEEINSEMQQTKPYDRLLEEPHLRRNGLPLLMTQESDGGGESTDEQSDDEKTINLQSPPSKPSKSFGLSTVTPPIRKKHSM